jgi:hypothetical protein
VKCDHCAEFFINVEELWIHLKRFPSHKSPSASHDHHSMVSLPVKYWLDKILEPLDNEQKKVIQLYLRGHHILLISAAGCGKTFTAKSLMRLLMAMYGDDYFSNHVAGIASTNVIAHNMGFLNFKGNDIQVIFLYFFCNFFYIFLFLKSI